MRAQLGGGVDGPSLLDRFRRLYTSEFGGSTIPADAEFWLHGLERVFGILAVPEHQKIGLASFNLKGDTLSWWENYHRQLTTPVDGMSPVLSHEICLCTTSTTSIVLRAIVLIRRMLFYILSNEAIL